MNCSGAINVILNRFHIDSKRFRVDSGQSRAIPGALLGRCQFTAYSKNHGAVMRDILGGIQRRLVVRSRGVTFGYAEVSQPHPKPCDILGGIVRVSWRCPDGILKVIWGHLVGILEIFS